MKLLFCILSFSLLSFPGHTQHSIDRVGICKGMGDVVRLVKSGRSAGIADTQNEGVAIISQISQHARHNLQPAIDNFISHTEALSADWTGTLYAHACIMKYDDNLPKVSLMTRFIVHRCDVERPDIHCAQRVYQNLPEGGII